MKLTDHPEIIRRAMRAPHGEKRIREREARFSTALVLASGLPKGKRKRWKLILDEARAIPSPKKMWGE